MLRNGGQEFGNTLSLIFKGQVHGSAHAHKLNYFFAIYY